jgi:hypothetical protein
VQAVFVYQLDDPRMPSCPEFLDQMVGFGQEPSLEPIAGTLELGP